MFERFTDRARRVIVLAQEEARMLDHNYIGTEHVLLGLIRDGEGAVPQTLNSFGITLEGVRAQVDEIIGRGPHVQSGHIPLTPRAKRVLELGLSEAQHLGQRYVDAEHLLLGVLQEGEGVAAQVLVKMGADLNAVRQQVLEFLAGEQGPPAILDGDEQRRPELGSERREVAKLRREVARLRGLLAQHGIDADGADDTTG